MRRLFSLAFVVLAIIVATLKVAEWASEEWWMNSLGFRSAQALYWQWRVEAFIPAFALWALVMGTNARLAWHNARWGDTSLPLLGPRALAGRTHIPPEDRVRLDLLARRGEQVFIALSAMMCGMAAANQFDLWVMAFHPPTFAEGDGGANATFLVGVWPALLWVWNAFGVLLGFTLGLVVTIAAFEGVLDFDTHGLRVGSATGRHLAFLTSLVIVWIGVRCGLSALGEPVNFGWSVRGISGFYERTFTNPIRIFFLLSSPFLAIWFMRTITRDALRPGIVALFWSASALFLPLMAPSFGRAMVSPSPTLDETLRVEQVNHLAITRRAWGLNKVQQRKLNVASSDFLLATQETDTAPKATEKTPGLVAWPHRGLRAALHENDTGGGLGRRPSDLYIDRQGRSLTARIIESDPSATSATSSLGWETDPSRGGQVNAVRRELNATLLQSPRVQSATFTRASNLDPLDGSVMPLVAHVRELEANAQGAVTRPNLLTNMTLALRFGDSSLLTGDKPVTWHLNPMERVQTLAPFVWWTDARPHPVWMRVGSGTSQRLFWLVEGCFVSRSFPGAAMIPVGGEWSNINYARQSVLGVCDATTGETNFYLFDPSEPLARTWNSLLPGFFKSPSELPAPLRAGTRLSPALLNAQTIIWARYHPGPEEANDVAQWAKRTDEWRSSGTLDTSENSALLQQVLIERNGQPSMELLAGFAPSGGTVTDSTALPNTPDPMRLIALLSARDEGESIWKEAGQPQLSAWRASDAIKLPLSDLSSESPLAFPFASPKFDKFALVPLLDARGDCVGMHISQGQAERKKINSDYGPWTLTTRVASTKTQFVALSPPASSKQADANLLRLRAVWKSWKDARANGRWERVEELEKEINRLLGP